MKHVVIVALILGFSATASGAPSWRIEPCIASHEWNSWRVIVRVAHDGDKPLPSSPRICGEGIEVVSVTPQTAEVAPGEEVLFFAELRVQGQPVTTPSAEFRVNRTKRTLDLPLGVDLSAHDWDMAAGPKDMTWATVMSAPGGDTQWTSRRLPGLIEAQGITWFRTRFTVPETLKGRTLRLQLGAVDDKDATFFNGAVIGRTEGWDTPRDYELPASGIRWGVENEIVVAVDNSNAGGGLYKMPLRIAVTGAAIAPATDMAAPRQAEADRKPAGPIGSSQPLFRGVTTRDGVLRYDDGGEVALWGVNYYPQSWTQYVSLKRTGGDWKSVVREDVADLLAMGVQMIRIHVFDTEFTTRDGGIVQNDHLDILEYLIAHCSERGLYMMLTPIAWWGSPCERPDSFSRNTPKQAMCMWNEAWEPQKRYLREFLTRINPYNQKRMCDQACLRFLEIINEPDYWRFGDLMTRTPGTTYLPPEPSMAGLEGVLRAYDAFLPGPEWRNQSTYAEFRRRQVRTYINTMVDAIRATGAKQTIAYFRTWWSDLPDVAQGIGESRCDCITTGAYPGGLPHTPENEHKNLLSELKDQTVETCFAGKARQVYEFDAPGTVQSTQTYPALARMLRNVGVQTACQFQYDSRRLAAWNPDWPTHYLNLWHTPEKAVSFMIAGETFRRTPRGTKYNAPEDDWVFGNTAVSFGRNAAIFSAPDCYMQARPTDWQPLALPERPRRVVSVGTCPYFQYDGTGVVMLTFDGDTAWLGVYPDVERLKIAMVGTPEEPLTRLQYNPHPFKLKMPGWEKASVARRQQDQSWTPLEGSAACFTALPGAYRLTR